MPLIKGKSKKAFEKNVETEMDSGKPKNQSLAVAYSVKSKAKKPKKMAEGGTVSAANEKRPSTQTEENDKASVSRNSGNKPANQDSWSSRPDIKQSTKGPKTTPIKHPKMVPQSTYTTRIRSEEDTLQSSASVNNGPQIQPPKHDDEEGPDRQGPSTPALKMKKMAEGGLINNKVSMAKAEEDHAEHPAGLEEDNDQIGDKDAMNDHMTMLAEGGIAHEMDDVPTEEADEERHNSIAAAIMAKKARILDHMDSGSKDMDEMVRMYEGGQVEGSDESMADIMANGAEHPNGYYPRNEDEVLKENYMEDMRDVSQPDDSNEKGDSRESETSNPHDMVDAIRRKMNVKRQFRDK